jgi:hypothetical protein
VLSLSSNVTDGTLTLPPHSDYHWAEFLKAVVGILGFVVNKNEGLITSGGLELLMRQVHACFVLGVCCFVSTGCLQTIHLIYLCLFQSEAYLPSPQAINECVVSVRSCILFSVVLIWCLAEV